LHPKIKEPVGQRLALQALAKVYGRNIVASGPVYKSMSIHGKQIRLTFDLNGGQLLKTPDNTPLHNFVIAGADRKFYPAKAVIDGDTVLVSCDQVTHPVAVRYAWSNVVPDCDFYSSNPFNLTLLPAGTFRTDDWQIGPAAAN
jgi:sialate O-acetylesterase